MSIRFSLQSYAISQTPNKLGRGRCVAFRGPAGDVSFTKFGSGCRLVWLAATSSEYLLAALSPFTPPAISLLLLPSTHYRPCDKRQYLSYPCTKVVAPLNCWSPLLRSLPELTDSFPHTLQPATTQNCDRYCDTRSGRCCACMPSAPSLCFAPLVAFCLLLPDLNTPTSELVVDLQSNLLLLQKHGNLLN